MKSYNNLWEKFISEENIRTCIEKAAVGKRKRNSVKRALSDIDTYVGIIRSYAENFENATHQEITIRDGNSGKERIIIVPRFKEHVIHHMVVQTMLPLLTTGMYKHTYSSIPGRGLHKCMKKMKAWIEHDPRNVKYCLKLDVKKFFNSIDHEVLIDKMRKYIKDERFLSVVIEIINASDRGIPIGFYTSHWFANWLLQPLDHLIKEELGVKYYVRYMDDMVLFGSNKRKLHEARKRIEEFLNNELHLRLKENWQLFRFDYIDKHGEHRGRALDFVGFKFYRDKIVLRKSIMLRLTRKIRKINKKGKLTIFDAHQLMAWLGWIDWTDTYNVYCKYVAKTINFKRCRKRISDYDHELATMKKALKKLSEEQESVGVRYLQI